MPEKTPDPFSARQTRMSAPRCCINFNNRNILVIVARGSMSVGPLKGSVSMAEQ